MSINEDYKNKIKSILEKCMDNSYDIFLGCRYIYDNKHNLKDIPDEIMDVFSAIASEVDDLPIGNEKIYWDPDILKKKNIEIENYRDQVKEIVLESMKKLYNYMKN